MKNQLQESLELYFGESLEKYDFNKSDKLTTKATAVALVGFITISKDFKTIELIEPEKTIGNLIVFHQGKSKSYENNYNVSVYGSNNSNGFEVANDNKKSIKFNDETYFLGEISLKVKKFTDGYSISKDSKNKKFKELSQVRNWIDNYVDVPYSMELEDVPYSMELEEISKKYSIPTEELINSMNDGMRQLVLSLESDEAKKVKEWVILTGPSGSGKTTLVEKYAKLIDRELITVQGDQQYSRADIVGFNSITTGKAFETALIDAVRNGKILLIDEIDACNPNVLLLLHSLKNEFFNSVSESIRIHEDFRLIATANAFRTYSDTYTARNVMDGATQKRFHEIEIDLSKAQLSLRFGMENTEKAFRLYNDETTPRDVQRVAVQEEIKKKYKDLSLDEILDIIK